MFNEVVSLPPLPPLGVDGALLLSVGWTDTALPIYGGDAWGEREGGRERGRKREREEERKKEGEREGEE